ncbi:hypothetical protein PAXRUDRAFT_822655 [Paxillus rubicundulus Ve08.2h10]|uniref:Uncharacterized protein n=1 Tax=Paxillus rubicundulus Ve08.2h10 TaxID=930991 RepID=A0A0D0E4W7_9AGAM|nr:hypothetical protein PAXRUDRAFT_822655 [Paxillus rubicundulus Ve08.2h10]
MSHAAGTPRTTARAKLGSRTDKIEHNTNSPSVVKPAIGVFRDKKRGSSYCSSCERALVGTQ